MKIFLIISLISLGILKLAKAVPFPAAPQPMFYRDLTLKIRDNVAFEVVLPGVKSTITYQFAWDTPAIKLPLLGDTHLNDKQPYFLRIFFDRMYTKSDSFIEINGEKLPLTCVFVSGQDNRFMKPNQTPLLPNFVLKVYIVANDFSCQGPLKPGWPATGGREENWDTYIYYEIRDPTIMLPTEAKVRYHWNETAMILSTRGGK
jgi:hypothetical protein